MILLEPGDVHDGHGPTPEGFTYRLLYIDPQWLHLRLGGLFEQRPDHYRMAFQDAMSSDARLALAIGTAFDVMHHGDFRITRRPASGVRRPLVAVWRSRQMSDGPGRSDPG